MTVDFHTHLGNILYPDGGALIFKPGVRKRPILDLITMAEWGLYRGTSWTEWLMRKFLSRMITGASRARNETATLENMRRSMDLAGVTSSVCLPLAPYVTFADLKKARELDPGVIPFTSVDFSVDLDLEKALADDVAQGARGLKLHPIIQKMPLDGPRSFAAVQVFSRFKLPILFHCGVYSYYLDGESAVKEEPANGAVSAAVKLVSAFPGTTFVAGHAGLFDYREVIRVLSGYHNVYVDISFQSPSSIRDLLKAFGPERVLYGSDWPWGDRRAAAGALRAACRGDRSLESLVFTDNAQRLLGPST